MTQKDITWTDVEPQRESFLHLPLIVKFTRSLSIILTLDVVRKVGNNWVRENSIRVLVGEEIPSNFNVLFGVRCRFMFCHY